MSADDVTKLAKAASEIGLDFWGIFLFTVVITGAGSLLLRAQKSQPQLTALELRPYRLFFYASFFSGLAAVVVSIGWSLYWRSKGIHTAQIAITDISPNVKIDSRYYSKTTLRRSHIDDSLVADEHFLIVNDKPFCQDDKFAFDVSVISEQATSDSSAGGIARRKTIEIPFSGQQLQSFRLELDPSSQPHLKATAAVSSSPQQEFRIARVKKEDSK